MDSEQREMIDKLWGLGNAIAGFTILQSLAVIYFSVQNPDVLDSWEQFIPLILIGIAAGAGLYTWVVRWCAVAERRIREDIKEDPKTIQVSYQVFLGRVAAIWIFNGLAISATGVSWLK